jgi:hypothetical protein
VHVGDAPPREHIGVGGRGLLIRRHTAPIMATTRAPDARRPPGSR